MMHRLVLLRLGSDLLLRRITMRIQTLAFSHLTKSNHKKPGMYLEDQLGVWGGWIWKGLKIGVCVC